MINFKDLMKKPFEKLKTFDDLEPAIDQNWRWHLSSFVSHTKVKFAHTLEEQLSKYYPESNTWLHSECKVLAIILEK